jgi:hypothetical protein
MHECKLPLNKCISPKVSSLDAKLPWKYELGTFLPLVGNARIKSTNAKHVLLKYTKNTTIC